MTCFLGRATKKIMPKNGSLAGIILRADRSLDGIFSLAYQRINGVGQSLQTFVKLRCANKGLHDLLSHTPAAAMVVMFFVFLRVLFTRYVMVEQAKLKPTSSTLPGPEIPLERPILSFSAWVSRGLLLTSVFALEEIFIFILRSLHSVDPRGNEYALLRTFVFPLPKFLSFLTGRLLSFRICELLMSWFVDDSNNSFEMLLRTQVIFLLGFYLTRRLLRNIWVYVQKRDGPSWLTVAINALLYVCVLALDSPSAAELKTSINSFVHDGLLKPYGDIFVHMGGFTSLALIGLLTCLMMPSAARSLLNGLWNIIRPDFQYIGTSYFLFQFYSMGSWGVLNNITPPIMTALQRDLPGPLASLLQFLADSSIIWSSFADVFFLFIIKLGELSTATAF